MKVIRGFGPITVVFETIEDVTAYRDFFGKTNPEKRMAISGITAKQDRILYDLWNEIDNILLEGK